MHVFFCLKKIGQIYKKTGARQTLLFLYCHSNTDSNMEVSSDPWSSWYPSTKSCINVHCPSNEVLFVQASLYNCPVYWEYIDQWRVTVIVAVCIVLWSIQETKKRTVLINDYILNETLWDFVRQEVLRVPLDFEVAVLWVVVSSWHSKVFLDHKTERYHGQTWWFGILGT